jgi:hypothetical protein
MKLLEWLKTSFVRVFGAAPTDATDGDNERLDWLLKDTELKCRKLVDKYSRFARREQSGSN